MHCHRPPLLRLSMMELQTRFCAIVLLCVLQAFHARLPPVPAPKIKLKLGGRAVAESAGRAAEVAAERPKQRGKRKRKEVEAAQEVHLSAHPAAVAHINKYIIKRRKYALRRD